MRSKTPKTDGALATKANAFFHWQIRTIEVALSKDVAELEKKKEQAIHAARFGAIGKAVDIVKDAWGIHNIRDVRYLAIVRRLRKLQESSNGTKSRTNS